MTTLEKVYGFFVDRLKKVALTLDDIKKSTEFKKLQVREQKELEKRLDAKIKQLKKLNAVSKNKDKKSKHSMHDFIAASKRDEFKKLVKRTKNSADKLKTSFKSDLKNFDLSRDSLNTKRDLFNSSNEKEKNEEDEKLLADFRKKKHDSKKILYDKSKKYFYN